MNSYSNQLIAGGWKLFLRRYRALGLRSPQAVVGDVEVADDGNHERALNAHLVGQSTDQIGNDGAADNGGHDQPRALAGQGS